MNRRFALPALILVLSGGLMISSACTTADGKPADQPPPEVAAIVATPVAAAEQPLTRFIRATGSLMAEDQAAVAAEIAGRVVATPVERGTSVAEGGVLVRVSPTEADAQAREAEANAAQIEARLGLTAGNAFDVNVVPEVQHAKSSYELAQHEFERVQSLLDQRVVSQSEFEQRRTAMETAQRQYEVAQERRRPAVPGAPGGARPGRDCQ